MKTEFPKGFHSIEISKTPQHLLAEMGAIVASFNKIEGVLYVYCRHLLNADKRIAQAVFANMRMSDLMSVTKRLIVASDLGDKYLEKVTNVFSEISELKVVRDCVAHRFALFPKDQSDPDTKDKVCFTNEPTSHSDDQIEHIIYSIDDLKKCSEAAEKLAQKLGILWLSKDKSIGLMEKIMEMIMSKFSPLLLKAGADPEEFRAGLLSSVETGFDKTLLEKLALPNLPGRRNQKKSPKSLPPPEASQK